RPALAGAIPSSPSSDPAGDPARLVLMTTRLGLEPLSPTFQHLHAVHPVVVEVPVGTPARCPQHRRDRVGLGVLGLMARLLRALAHAGELARSQCHVHHLLSSSPSP